MPPDQGRIPQLEPIARTYARPTPLSPLPNFDYNNPMKKIGNRTWLALRFGLSVLSVVTNVLIVSGINERLRGVEGNP